MADFITAVGTYAELSAWYSGIPSSVPSGDRYIAEVSGTAGIAMGSSTWNTKTLVSAGQIIIRAAAGAKAGGSPPAAYKDAGVATLYHTFGSLVTFGSNIAGGFVLEDIQLVSFQNGGFTFAAGSRVDRCLVRNTSSNANTPNFTSTGLAVNSIFIRDAGVTGAAMQASGTGAHTSNTFITFADGVALALSGTFQNAAWKNNYAVNLSGGSADPWPSPPTSFFSGASNNATSLGTQGNCPGSSAVVGASGAANFAAVGTGATTMNATPVAGSALRNAGVVASSNGGVDWYNATRPGTPGIGAAEYAAPASTISGNATLDNIAPAGELIVSLSGIAGGLTLDDYMPGGTLDVAPGAIVVPELRNWAGSLQAGVTVPVVTVCRLSDGAQVLTLTNQVSDGSGHINIASASIITGTWYMVVGWNADASARFARPVQAT
jgi:hypothetical protein